MSHDDLKVICRVIKQAVGIELESDQYPTIQRYVNKRMEVNKIGLSDYLSLLHEKSEHSELIELLSLVLNHETYFFRDFEQLEFFAEYCLPELKKRKYDAGSNVLKVWSAGCSTGAEAYTLSIILNIMSEEEVWDYTIYATDIDPQVLDIAKKGLYPNSAAQTIPYEYLNVYFEKTTKGIQVHPVLAQDIHFMLLNLVDMEHMNKMSRFDFIFCKNVLFYFGKMTQERIIQQFYDSLNPGGYLFLGYSNEIKSFMKSLSLQSSGTYYYQKAF